MTGCSCRWAPPSRCASRAPGSPRPRSTRSCAHCKEPARADLPRGRDGAGGRQARARRRHRRRHGPGGPGHRAGGVHAVRVHVDAAAQAPGRLRQGRPADGHPREPRRRRARARGPRPATCWSSPTRSTVSSPPCRGKRERSGARAVLRRRRREPDEEPTTPGRLGAGARRGRGTPQRRRSLALVGALASAVAIAYLARATRHRRASLDWAARRGAWARSALGYLVGAGRRADPAAGRRRPGRPDPARPDLAGPHLGCARAGSSTTRGAGPARDGRLVLVARNAERAARGAATAAVAASQADQALRRAVRRPAGPLHPGQRCRRRADRGSHRAGRAATRGRVSVEVLPASRSRGRRGGAEPPRRSSPSSPTTEAGSSTDEAGTEAEPRRGDRATGATPGRAWRTSSTPSRPGSSGGAATSRRADDEGGGRRPMRTSDPRPPRGDGERHARRPCATRSGRRAEVTVAVATDERRAGAGVAASCAGPAASTSSRTPRPGATGSARSPGPATRSSPSSSTTSRSSPPPTRSSAPSWPRPAPGSASPSTSWPSAPGSART